MERFYVEGEVAIKPYFYFRNGYLHIRYNTDKAIALSESEVKRIKEELSSSPADKQNILRANWDFQVHQVGKSIISNGIALADSIVEKKNGCKS